MKAGDDELVPVSAESAISADKGASEEAGGTALAAPEVKGNEEEEVMVGVFKAAAGAGPGHSGARGWLGTGPLLRSTPVWRAAMGPP